MNSWGRVATTFSIPDSRVTTTEIPLEKLDSILFVFDAEFPFVAVAIISDISDGLCMFTKLLKVEDELVISAVMLVPLRSTSKSKPSSVTRI